MSTILIGNDMWKARKNNETVPIFWDENRISNHHVGIAGTSGSGKTHWLKKFIDSVPTSVTIDIFDYHGDIDVPGATSVLFSEQNRYGYNPLVINLDPVYGGVRRAQNDLIAALNRSRKLGDTQEAVLRNLITDAYEVKRIYQDNPASWKRIDSPESEIMALYKGNDPDKWKKLSECYPSLYDLELMINRKLRLSLFGLDDRKESRNALFKYESFIAKTSALKKAKIKFRRSGGASDDEIAKLQEKVDKLKMEAIESYERALEATDDGKEMDDMFKYQNTETLQSLLLRIQNLRAIGIFNANCPPFGNARIRRHNLKPLAQSEDELIMYVHYRMNAIFREEMQRGESHGKLRHLIILDESKKFADDKVTNPINKIANEARKYGVGLILAGQSPEHFSDDFIKNAGTLLMLNLATSDWDGAARKLKIKPDSLKYLQPRKTALVRMLNSGESASFQSVIFPQS
ncbi:TPA: ATP-binding protein [Salmonella enterica subsp. salamae serovar 35:g,m,s,t:-]|nr:ATP-binding protein [Salmonella enterica subsp. salamae serovar 35:g,m,s,t:-]HCA3549692.1 ATP-binding protein [Salmonella enterica subsp. salamae serovar 35:g,m,s,t:-]